MSLCERQMSLGRATLVLCALASKGLDIPSSEIPSKPRSTAAPRRLSGGDFSIDITHLSTFQINLRIGAYFPSYEEEHYEHCAVYACEWSTADVSCRAFARLHRVVVDGGRGRTFETTLTLYDLSHGTIRRLLEAYRKQERFLFGLSLSGRNCPGVTGLSSEIMSGSADDDEEGEPRIEQVAAIGAARPALLLNAHGRLRAGVFAAGRHRFDGPA